MSRGKLRIMNADLVRSSDRCQPLSTNHYPLAGVSLIQQRAHGINLGGYGCRGRHSPFVLQFERMSQTITIRLTSELARWLEERRRQTGIPVSRIIRHQLERAKSETGKQRFLRHAGKISGPQDLSSRKGFALS